MSFLKNQILISTTNITDNVFSKSVVYICDHNKNGAMGLIINKTIRNCEVHLINKKDFDLDLELFSTLYFGGPVSIEYGLVLHQTDFLVDDPLIVSDTIALTNKKKILKKIINKKNIPYKIMLGHCSWAPNQLEKEIECGDWLMQNTTDDFIFNFPSKQMWDHATYSLGIESESFFIN